MAGVVLGGLVLMPLIFVAWFNGPGGRGPESLETVPLEGAPLPEVRSSRVPSDPEIHPRAIPTRRMPAAHTVDARAIGADLREAILSGGDLDSILSRSKGDLPGAIRALLAIIKDEEDLRTLARLIGGLGSLPDPSDDIIKFCRRELLTEDRPILRLFYAELLEERPTEGSIGTFREVLDQHWFEKNPREGWGVVRAALRGLGKVGTKAAREEIWRRFWGAPDDEFGSEALEALALSWDVEVATGIQGVIADSTLSEAARLGAVRALATGLRANPGKVDVTLDELFGKVREDGLRAEIVKCAAESGTRRNLQFVENRLLDRREDRPIRVSAVLALHHYGDWKTLGVLRLVEDREQDRRLVSLARTAADAIRVRTGG